MKDFDVLDPMNVSEAVSLLSRHGADAKVLAGGMSLLLLMRQGLVAPSCLINIKRIAEIHGVRLSGDGGLSIGALTTHAEVISSPQVQRGCPVLSEAASLTGSVHMR